MRSGGVVCVQLARSDSILGSTGTRDSHCLFSPFVARRGVRGY